MNNQAEVYSILGLKVPANEVSKGSVYDVAGRRVAIDDLVSEPHDFVHGVKFDGAATVEPKLSFYLLGVDTNSGRSLRDFHGEALVGYAIANGPRASSAAKLPDGTLLEKLKAKLALDVFQNFGYRLNFSEVGLYLLSDPVD